MSWRETLGVTPSAEPLYTHNTHNTQNPTGTGNCADIADFAYRGPEQENSKLLEARHCEVVAMSWRETLGVTPSAEPLYTHNSQNTQNPTETGNCADIADSAYRDSEQENSKLLEALADACKGLDITPAEVKQAEDIADWCSGAISADTLAAFARSLVQRREMDQGKRPDHFTGQATCKHCGPVWLWFSGEVLGCPWCRNRLADKPIPRPCSIHCGDCIHFERIDHPHLGHCAKGEPEAIAGLWDTDQRYCERFLPEPQQTHSGQPRPARAETKR